MKLLGRIEAKLERLYAERAINPTDEAVAERIEALEAVKAKLAA